MVMAMMGPSNCRVLSKAASTRPMPLRISRDTFSTTTMASSTTRPTDKTMASRVSRFSENPIAIMAAMAPMREIGMVTRGTSALRADPRNRNTMMPTMATVSTNVVAISFSEFSMYTVPS